MATVTVPAPAPQAPGVAARRRHLAGNVLIVGASFALAAAAAIVRNMVIAQRFGIGAELDAYYAAFKLPDLLFTIVAGGALATAFIPVFAEVLTGEGRDEAWRLGAAITNLVVLVVSSLAALAALAAPLLVGRFIAPGFTPAQQAETAGLLRILLISTLVFGVSAVQGSVLHGFKHFLLPALAPVVYPLGIIAGALFLAPTMGVRGLAVGAVAGSVLHLLIKIPALLRYGFHWWPVLDLGRPAVRRVLVLMGPRVLDLGVFHLTLLVTTNLASRLGAGSVSALEYGWSAMQLPETIIGTAFGLVAFPTLAELAAKRDFAGLRSTLGESLRAVLALAVPAAAGLILLGRPIIAILYQRGAFDAQATEAVYLALRFYALGLLGHACLELAARAFFAQQDMITPLIVAACSAAGNIALALILIGPLGYPGLALSNSIAISIEVLVLLYLLRRRLGHVEERQSLSALGRILIAAAAMAAVITLVQGAVDGRGALVAAVAAGGAGVLVYAIVAFALGLRLPITRAQKP